jgi:hypothetical protein
MKQIAIKLLRDWWVGFHFLVRAVIACFVMGSGYCTLSELALSIPLSWNILLLLEFFYLAGFCPFFLASYARYCGYASRKNERSAS